MPRKLIDAEVVEIRPKDALSPAIEIKLAGETFPRLRVNADGSLYSGAGVAEPATAVGGSLAADYEAAIERLVLTMAAAETRAPLLILDSAGDVRLEFLDNWQSNTGWRRFAVGDADSDYDYAEVHIKTPVAGSSEANFELEAARWDDAGAFGLIRSKIVAPIATDTALSYTSLETNRAWIKLVADDNDASHGRSYIEAKQSTTDPAAPAAGMFRLFAKDNGAGKMQLMALFPTGVAQQVAIEP